MNTPPSSSADQDTSDQPIYILEPIEGHNLIGGLFIMLGLMLMVFFGVFYFIAVDAGGHSVVNLGLISDRECGVTFGGFLLIAGSVFLTSSGSYRFRPRRKN